MTHLRSRSRSPLAVCLLVALAAAASPALAQPAPPAFHDETTLPEGEAGTRIRDLLDVVSSGDAARVKAFVQSAFAPAFLAAFPIEEHVGILLDAHDRSRGFDFHGIRRYEGPGGPAGTVVIVRNRLTSGWEAFVLDLEPGPPHRIAGLEFAPARPPAGLPPVPPLTLDEAVSELSAFVESLAKADAFSGSVLLAKDGRILYKAAWGDAIKGYGVPNRIDTKFNLGSMNKMFTGVAISRLAEKGKLSLEDPLSKHLPPDWLPKVDMSKIRVEHLLTHTSGLGSYFNETFRRASRQLFRTLEDYKPLTAGETLAFEPGSSWQYSNTGFLLLGAVIEKVTGVSYFDYVRRNVYEPAGMSDTDCYEMDFLVPNLAFGYTREHTAAGIAWRNNLYQHVIKGGPAGGGFSTAEDLFRFAEALRSHRLLPSGATERLWSPRPDLGSTSYGYGFGISGGPLGKIAGHSGGFNGISSNLDMLLDAGYTSVVLSNYDHGSQPVARRILELLGRVPR